MCTYSVINFFSLLGVVYSLLPFLQGIIEQDYDLVRSFVPHLLRYVVSQHVESDPECASCY
jgi:hypothetical protein